ncbi:hypothetical protein JHK85_013031 [Glycine max]|nr:hypothetical protein JHK85_013031 [Glycine max]
MYDAAPHTKPPRHTQNLKRVSLPFSVTHSAKEKCRQFGWWVLHQRQQPVAEDRVLVALGVHIGQSNFSALRWDAKPLLQSPPRHSRTPQRRHRNQKKQKNIATPIVASISGVLILLVAVAILWTLKRRKSKEKSTALMEVNDESKISRLQSKEEDDSLLQVKKQIYSYSDVLKITNNFNTIIGKGGFGTIYLGYMDDSPVAVKVLSPSIVHGFQQFQAEVKLLIRVHHKNLTSLIGYCNEGTNKAFIYEYIANGNLQEHLSG